MRIAKCLLLLLPLLLLQVPSRSQATPGQWILDLGKCLFPNSSEWYRCYWSIYVPGQVHKHHLERTLTRTFSCMANLARHHSPLCSNHDSSCIPSTCVPFSNIPSIQMCPYSQRGLNCRGFELCPPLYMCQNGTIF